MTAKASILFTTTCAFGATAKVQGKQVNTAGEWNLHSIYGEYGFLQEIFRSLFFCCVDDLRFVDDDLVYFNARSTQKRENCIYVCIYIYIYICIHTVIYSLSLGIGGG